MKVVNNEEIKKFLQDEEVRDRVCQHMLDARTRATVTISVAAALSGFTESQLREWDKKGYLQTDRTIPATEGKGHRQYTPQDLDKLMLMRELVNKGYSLGDIFQNLDGLWKQFASEQQTQQLTSAVTNQQTRPTLEAEPRHYPIDVRVERADEEYFGRYFVSEVLRLCLLLITEDMPSSIAGLILPLERREPSQRITSPNNIDQAGPSLVGWLAANQSIFTIYDPVPSFEYPSDFRIEYMRGWDEKVCPSPLVVLQRKARPLTLTEEQVASIQRVIELIYQQNSKWQTYFGHVRRDYVDHATNFWLNEDITDTLLDRLMDRIVELGGKVNGHNRWAFCDLFLPRDPTLPKQQRTLIVRASSKDSPARTNWMELSYDRPGLTYRVYQSGQAIYRSRFYSDDPLLAYQETEPLTRSAIAIPLGSADGMTAGAFYIASNNEDAFALADQRTLRLLTRMAEELLAAYQGRVFVSEDLSDALANPKVVDSFFANFLSEEDLINEYEELLTSIHQQENRKELEGKQVSFIELDIDNQSSLTLMYGDRATRNLSCEVGLRLQRQMGLQSNRDYRRVYHVGADRYVLRLIGMSLGDARNLAEQLRVLLNGDYRVDIRRSGKPLTNQEMLLLQNVTVRLGVQNWPYLKLKELLERHGRDVAVAQVVRTVSFDNNFEVALKMGQAEGGDCVISWDTSVWNYIRWSPSKTA